MTDEEKKALEKIDGTDKLCKYCPWTKEQHHPESLCEGCCCEEAKENYLEEIDLEED